MKIAVLGMGRMGQALAGRLLDNGHDVAVWNRNPDKTAGLAARGAMVGKSPADVVAAAEIAVTTLANDDAVREVALGPGGVRRGLPEGALLVDSSTVSPGLSEELDGQFDRFAAMPILGSPSQVASGQAMYLIGAANDAVVRALDPVLSGLARRSLVYDRPARAAVAKLTVNLLLLDAVAALAEAFAVGRSGGLSDDELRDLLTDSPMVAPGLKYRFDGILTGEQETLWTTVLGVKDAGLAIDVARSAEIDLPITETARDLLDEAAGWEGGAEADIASVTRRYLRGRPS